MISLKIFFDNSIEAYENSNNGNQINKIDIIINQENDNLKLQFIDYGVGIPSDIKIQFFLRGFLLKVRTGLLV